VDTVRHIWQGGQLLRDYPNLRAYVWKPLGWAVAAVTAIFLVGLCATNALVRANIGDSGVLLAEVAGLIGYFLIWWLIGPAAFLAIASFTSSLLWDPLGVEVERITLGTAAEAHLSKGALARDSILRLMFAVFIGIFALVAAAFATPVAGILVAGYGATIDVTAGAFLRRGVRLGGQFGRIYKLPGFPSFAAVAGLLTLLPVVNVLFLPVLVTGATIMVAKAKG